MQRIKLNRRNVVTAIFGVALIAAPAVASAASGPGPQSLSVGKAALATATPDQCVLQKQLNPTEQKYRLTNNVPTTYTTAGSFFNIKCGSLSFTVPQGQDALVDLSSAAELNCDAPNNVTSATPTNGWCEGRFYVSGANVLPNNTGRSDTFAWDSSNAGTFSWQANTLEQVAHVSCPQSPAGGAPCVYNVILQSRLDNGATSLWLDDNTIKVDVSEGPVTTSFPTP